MKNIKFAGLVSLVSALAFGFVAFAQGPSTAPGLVSADLPTEAGVYDVPGHKNLKLRVIVHYGKPTNPGHGGGGGGGGGGSLTETCNLADTNGGTPVTPDGGWKIVSSTGNPWIYHVNPSSAPSSLQGDVETIAHNAFGAWQSAIGSNITVAEGAQTGTNRAQFDGQNIVAWGRTQGTALAVTYIWYDTSTTPYTATELDTIMNQKFAWAWDDPSSWTSAKTAAGTTCAYSGVYDAQDILTHELGHWMGLDDTYDSSFQNNTMFGYGSPTETKKDSLSSGDVTGVQNIYQP